MKMKKQIYGLIGVASLMGNWNSDFTGNPKMTLNGKIYGSDKALKYSFRNLWDTNGEDVLYFKSYKENLQPRELDERFELIFGSENKKEKKGSKDLEVLKNLFGIVDVKQFGATFPSKKFGNLSILGAVQIGQGFNYFKNTINTQEVLSPFKNSSNETADNSSIGKMIMTDEAHYLYPFNINPNAYREYEKLGATEGYTEEDYKKFKETSLKSVTSLNSASKFGCYNEFALFVETDISTSLPPMDIFVSYEKDENDKGTVTFNLGNVLEKVKGQIKKVEVYLLKDKMNFVTDLEKAGVKVEVFEI